MNNSRRKEIARIKEIVEALTSQIEELHGDIDNVLSEEQEAFDALPESFQDSDRGQTIQSAIDNLQSALDEADNLSSSISEIVTALEGAAE